MFLFIRKGLLLRHNRIESKALHLPFVLVYKAYFIRKTLILSFRFKKNESNLVLYIRLENILDRRVFYLQVINFRYLYQVEKLVFLIKLLYLGL